MRFTVDLVTFRETVGSRNDCPQQTAIYVRRDILLWLHDVHSYNVRTQNARDWYHSPLATDKVHFFETCI